MFLLSKEWDDHFVGVIQVVVPRLISDHCRIKLCSNSIDWGPRSFRFENCWLQNKDLLGLARSWWRPEDVRGFVGYRIYKKLRRLY